MYMAVIHFRQLIEGRPLTIYTDHKPLTTSLTSMTNAMPPTRLRHLRFISEFTSDIRYKKGEHNVSADYLSRYTPSVNSVTTFTLETLRDTQLRDPHLHKMQLQEVEIRGISVFCDMSEEHPRPYIPSTLRTAAFQQIHNDTHPGIKATTTLLKARYYWPHMTSSIRIMTRACPNCNRAKVTRHIRAPIGTFENAEPLQHIHIDLLGPFPASNGYKFCLTIIDRATGWPECIPIRNITAKTVIEQLYDNWISRFGAPSIITTDQGTQFMSDIFKKFCAAMGIQNIHTNAYHPQANGMIERFHRTLNEAIMTSSSAAKWAQDMTSLLLGIRNRPSTDGISPSQRLYGTTPRLPNDLFTPSTPDVIPYRNHDTYRKTTKTYYPRTMNTAEQIYVRIDTPRAKLTPPYKGPFTILANDGKTLTYQDDIGKTHNVSVDRCKPAPQHKRCAPNQAQSSPTSDWPPPPTDPVPPPRRSERIKAARQPPTNHSTIMSLSKQDWLPSLSPTPSPPRPAIAQPEVRQPTRPPKPPTNKPPPLSKAAKKLATQLHRPFQNPMPLPRPPPTMPASKHGPEVMGIERRPRSPTLHFRLPPFAQQCLHCCIHGIHFPRHTDASTQTAPQPRTTPPPPSSPRYSPGHLTQQQPPPPPPPEWRQMAAPRQVAPRRHRFLSRHRDRSRLDRSRRR
uniref:RNA-directed DNA polymerase n=1 Tax=Lygus hesperus TaxID=30085 RepID=A0A0A9W9N1_LYGHE